MKIVDAKVAKMLKKAAEEEDEDEELKEEESDEEGDDEVVEIVIDDEAEDDVMEGDEGEEEEGQERQAKKIKLEKTEDEKKPVTVYPTLFCCGSLSLNNPRKVEKKTVVKNKNKAAEQKKGLPAYDLWGAAPGNPHLYLFSSLIFGS